MAEKHIVSPRFALDVDGRLFKEKADNPDVQDTLIFNDIFTRLSITKGDLPLFPNLGLKQHLYNFGFQDTSGLSMSIAEFEDDMETQIGRDVTITHKTDVSDKSVEIFIGVQGLKYPISFKYLQLQNSIKIIDYKFNS